MSTNLENTHTVSSQFAGVEWNYPEMWLLALKTIRNWHQPSSEQRILTVESRIECFSIKVLYEERKKQTQ